MRKSKAKATLLALVTNDLGTSGMGASGQYRFELELSSKPQADKPHATAHCLHRKALSRILNLHI